MIILKYAGRLALATAGLVLGAAAPLPASAPPAAALTPAPKPITVLFTGGPSELLYPRSLWGASEHACASFVLLPAQPIKALRLTTSGLGDARLARGADCPGPADARILDLSGLKTAQTISIRVTPDRSAGDYRGKLVALDGSEPFATSDFTVLQPVDAPFVTAWKWAWGLIIPAGITFCLARFGVWWDARRKEDQEFLRFQSTEHTAILAAFRDIELELTSNGITHRGARTWKTLHEKKILAGLPRKDHAALAKACDVGRNKEGIGDHAKIREILVRVFPTQAHILKGTST